MGQGFDNPAYFLSEDDRKLLIALMCEEQSRMIQENPECYTSEHYVHLEKLKIQLKD